MPCFSRGRSNYEITKLRADRCLLFPGGGQITRLRNYEITSNYFWHFWHITDHYCLALMNSSTGDMQTLNKNINTLMEKGSANGKRTFRCKVCGKESSHCNDMKKHIEATHLDGVSLQCSQCEKTFRSRNALAQHIHYTHKRHSES